ncbi:MAG: hypothetical protein M1832_002158 [Thelocarpon impressellum]|nr:MAG: hypothetical protein M1832_002158 [Thelocarpon impressellum]
MKRSERSPRKIDDERIFASGKLRRTTKHGRPVLCDFGEVRFGAEEYDGFIQPDLYQAPEDLF